MGPKPPGLSLSDFLACIVYLTYGLVVHCLTSLSTWGHSSCQHIWLKFVDNITYPLRTAATTLQQMTDLVVNSCRSRWQVFGSVCTYLWSFGPTVIVANVGARASDAIATVGTLVVDLCCNAILTVCHHCACTLCTALSNLICAAMGALLYPLVGAGQILRRFVPDNLACTAFAVLRVIQFFWHEFRVRGTLSIIGFALKIFMAAYR